MKIRGGVAVFSLNKKIYPLDVIYSAAYVMLDRAYFLLDEERGRIKVKIRPKEPSMLKQIADAFSQELINYGFYKRQLEKNADIKRIMLNEAFSHALDAEPSNPSDPEGIMIPWEVKYGSRKAK
ncbi:MAG: His-Xaa-Ser system protein HxsD [Candidatus Woesearchaeota archaeon]